MDLCAASDFLLMPQMGVQPIPVLAPKPLPEGTIGLLLGRGSLTLQGLVVIDDQHSPEIQVLCSSPNGIFSINRGHRIAQLLLLPSDPHYGTGNKWMGSSGSDSAYLVVQLHDRPRLLLWINGKSFEGILDTGADWSIISSHWWLKSWPVTESSHSLQGLGYSSHPTISSSMLTWKSEEGHQGQFIPYVLPLPVNLWGRDILQGLGLVLSNEYSPQAVNIMKKMGYEHGKGLGHLKQGQVEPISPDPNPGRQGLGFS